MKLVVTGCTGRVGQRVVIAALKQGHSVVGIDVASNELPFAADPAFTFVQADLQDYEVTLNAFKGCDGIVQLAAIPAPVDYIAKTHNT